MKFQRCDFAAKFIPLIQPRMEFGNSSHNMPWHVVWHCVWASERHGWAAKMAPCHGPKLEDWKLAVPCGSYGQDGWRRHVSGLSMSWMYYDVSPCIFLGCPNLELQNGVCLKVMIYFETSVCVDDLQLLLEWMLLWSPRRRQDYLIQPKRCILRESLLTGGVPKKSDGRSTCHIVTDNLQYTVIIGFFVSWRVWLCNIVHSPRPDPVPSAPPRNK